MAIPYTPDTNENARFFEEGIGQFEVIGYEEKLSKTSGKLMGVLNIRIWDPKGKHGPQYDYLIPNREFTATRIKTFLKSIGREEDNLMGQFDGSKYIGLGGRLRLKYEVDRNDAEGRERLRFHYLEPEKTGEVKKEEPVFVDDDIQF